MISRPLVPPFTLETAIAKVRAAEDAWNTRDPQKVSLAYTEDSFWNSCSHYFAFLSSSDVFSPTTCGYGPP